MKQFFLGGGLEAAVAGEQCSLIGELTSAHEDILELWLQSMPPMSILDLAEFDIADGVAATHAVNAVRLMCPRVPLLQIVAAPQVLAHSLYRTGLLSQSGIELIAMREDEAYG